MFDFTDQDLINLSNEISKYIAKPYSASNIVISTGAFETDADNTIDGYPYKAKYLDGHILETDKIVSFDLDSETINSNVIYDNVGLVDGGFYLFASKIPEQDVVIENLVIIRNSGGDWMKTVDVSDEFKASIPKTYATKEDATDVYSTEEVKTGDYWVDGKPIYRRVVKYSGDMKNANIIDSSLTLNLVDSIIKIGGYYKATNGRKHPIPKGYYQSSSYNSFVSVSVGDSGLMLLNLHGTSETDPEYLYVIVEYTKTTN